MVRVLYHSKYESNLGHEIVYNYIISYLMTLVMIGPEFFEDPKNKQITFWPKRNQIILDKMMMKMCNK